MEQKTTEWYLARKGRFTASDISDLLATSKKKGEVFGDTAMSYINSKINEILMPNSTFIDFIDEYQLSTPAIRWGNMFEDEARNLYAERTGFIVLETGFFEYGNFAGGSPDGIMPSEDGIIEIKCPFEGNKHIMFMEMTKPEDLLNVNKKYYYQVQANMLFTGTSFCDFISFNPRMSDLMKMKQLRIDRDNNAINLLKERIQLASELLESKISNLSRIAREQYVQYGTISSEYSTRT